MKNYVKYIITAGILLSLLLVFKGYYKEQYIKVKDEKFTYSIKYKGLDSARDFVVDEKGNYYIAYKNKIQFIDLNGKSFNLLMDKTLNINSLEYNKNKLYYASDSKVYCYDLQKKEQQILINELPNFGDYKESMIRIYGDLLYVTIGAATNSGVVGNDNSWIMDNPFYFDLSPKNITLKGNNYGSEKTGAFVPYKTKNIKGQLITGHFPGNGTVISYNLKSGNLENFAWGIRNIKGLDFNSEGKLLATVGGIENRGLRPISGDVDYIFEIKKGLWYGWPDYSGGDPVNSPRFKGENRSKVEFLLENHPTSNPPAPIYQHKSLTALGSLTIDSKGEIGDKDCIYFYDSRDNILYSLTKGNSLNEKAKFNEDSYISSIKVANNSLLLLDNKEGVLYSLHKNTSNNLINFGNNLIYYLLIVILVVITIIVWKFGYNSKKH